MALPTNTYSRHDLGTSVREDLTDFISNIAPTKTPFQMICGKTKASLDLHQWNIDDLDDPSTNEQLDGDDHTGEVLSSPDRVGNYCQISRKAITVSGRADVVKKPGRGKETAYQLVKKGFELRRDVEYSLLTRQIQRVGSESEAPRSAGLPVWLRTNAVLNGATAPGAQGATGVASAGSAGTGNGTAMKEDAWLSVIQQAYDEGGDPSCVMLGTELKQKFSSYMFTDDSRIADQYQDQGGRPSGEGARVLGAVSYYVSDFGTLEVKPNRFIPKETQGTGEVQCVFFLDPMFWKVAYLRGYHRINIAKTGDSTKRMLLVDWCLEARNEKSSGVIRGVNVDLDMSKS